MYYNAIMEKTLPFILFWLLPFSAYAAFRLFRLEEYAYLMKSGRLSRHGYYTVVCLAGFFSAAGGPAGLAVYEHAVFCISIVFVINALFFSSLLVNNVYDSDIDKENGKHNTSLMAGKRSHFIAAAVASVYALILAACLSPAAFLAAAVITAVSAAYSAPPLRLKRFFPLNTMTIAFCTVLAFLLGYYAFPRQISGPPFTFLLFLFAGLSLAFNVKDINDAAGDKKYGIATLPSLLGRKAAAYSVAACAFAGYMVFSLWEFSWLKLALSGAAGAATAALIISGRGKVNEGAVFAVLAAYFAAYAFVCFAVYAAPV